MIPGYRGKSGFQWLHVIQRGLVGHVPPVQQRVNVEARDAALGGVVNDPLEMGKVAVDVAVGEQSDQVQRRVALQAVGDETVQHFPAEKVPAVNGSLNPGGALRENEAGAHGHVADLGAADVGRGRQTHVQPVGVDDAGGAALHHAAQGGRVCLV